MNIAAGRISFDGTQTPVKTALFLLVCAAWLLPGLVGHDPWKVDDAVSFGAVSEILRTGDWIAFRLAGEPWLGEAPLFLWVAAVFAKVFGGLLPLHDAARLAAGFFMAATLGLLSATLLELSGERAMRIGVLLFIGSLGLLIRAHEMSTSLAGLTGIAAALYGFALALRRPALGGAVIGAGLGAAFLGDGFLPAAMVLTLLVLLPAAGPAWRGRGYLAAAGVALACAAPFVGAWLLAVSASGPGAITLWLGHASAQRWALGGGGEGFSLGYFLRTLPWYAWPAWPLAAWTLWRARRALARRNDLLLPLAAFVSFLLAVSAFGEARELDAMPLLLPLAILGVAEIDSLPRGGASALDWFGMTTFFLLAALIWIGWVAALTGKPIFAAAWLQKEVPGFTYRFSFLSFALASLLTLLWLVVVARSLRSTRRAIVNWAAGITMVWMLVMTLGAPLVDQARSYRTVAARISGALPADHRCIARRNVGDAQRVLLDYFAGLRTVREEFPLATRCRALLIQATVSRLPLPEAAWEETWRGARPGDKNEVFILYRRR